MQGFTHASLFFVLHGISSTSYQNTNCFRTHYAVYLGIYMLVNYYAPCYSNTRASETSKLKTMITVCRDRRQYHDSKCLEAVVSQIQAQDG